MDGSIPTEIRDFFSFSVWAHFLSRVVAQKILFGKFIQHFNMKHLNHCIYLIVLSDQTLMVTHSPTCSFAANYLLKDTEYLELCF